MQKRGKVKKSTLRAAKRGKKIIGGKSVKVGAQEVRALRKGLKGQSARLRKITRQKMKRAKTHNAADLKMWAKGKKMASDVEIESASSLAELDAHLSELRSVVSPRNAVVESVSNKLLDGLKGIYDKATSYYEAVATEIKESEERVADDDSRVAIGRHFESIANDAYSVAELIAEGEVDLHDAADDMQALAADLEDALEATKKID